MTDTQTAAAAQNWEAFRDLSYFDMWCVRRKSDRSFGDGFHILRQDEAERLRDYLEEQDAEIASGAAILAYAETRISALSRQLGEAEGRLAASELPGVVEGWKRRAEDAEAEVARLRGEASYQARVGVWLEETFVQDTCKSVIERAMRFLEESLELCQSLDLTAVQASKVADYVYGRPVGEPSQEVGGVMVTLASLCHSTGMDMQAAGETEYARINQPEIREKIRAKQVSKKLFGMTHDTAALSQEPK